MSQTTDEKNEKIDRNLSGVATTLAGVFVAIAGVSTAFGFSQSSLLTAVNNDTLRFLGVAALALLAIGMSIWSLFQGADPTGNRRQSLMLGVGVFFYLGALLLAITGVAEYATGNGRPNVRSLSVVPGSPYKVSFEVHADGVQGSTMVIVEAEAFEGERPTDEGVLYRTILHADDGGDIDQKVEFVMEKGKATRLTVRAFPDHENKDGATCESSSSPHKLGCATVILPASTAAKHS
ncbi:hypothetical protein ACIPYQ_37185 [Streptomyces sp. NPDC090045]|uniref:hypothetical protein n=1 Tax=Streptomyces sp. NPDC090045 TaxID=3365927 RepID=UPI00380DDBBF